jgi:hypothetical protein
MDGHVACMGGVRNAYKFWWKNLHLDSLHMDGSIILKCVLRVYGGRD